MGSLVQIQYRPEQTGVAMGSAGFFSAFYRNRMVFEACRFVPAEGKDFVFSAGDLEGRLVATEDGIRMHLDGRVFATFPDLKGWRDISLPEKHEIFLVPRTPDLPVVLRSEELMELAVDSTMDMEVLLPLWLQVCHTGKKDRKTVEGVLEDIPTISMKRSWFGTPESGEVAYSWRFYPRDRRSYQRHLLTVPVTIHNRSSSVLRFERVLLRVIHLGVFSLGERLMTNKVTIVFKGTEQLSQISFESDESVKRRGGISRSGPREQSNSAIIRKSFSWLRELAG
jgi:hypothetical protein